SLTVGYRCHRCDFKIYPILFDNLHVILTPAKGRDPSPQATALDDVPRSGEPVGNRRPKPSSRRDDRVRSKSITPTFGRDGGRGRSRGGTKVLRPVFVSRSFSG